MQWSSVTVWHTASSIVAVREPAGPREGEQYTNPHAYSPEVN